MKTRNCGPVDVRRFVEGDQASEAPESDGCPYPCYSFLTNSFNQNHKTYLG